MTIDRPIWADALKDVLTGLANSTPKPLLPGVEYFAQTTVTPHELEQFLLAAEDNDPALFQLRLAIAGWDADTSREYLDNTGNATAPRSVERRTVIYEALGFSAVTSSVVSERIPVFKKPVIEISRKFEPWYADARKQRTSVYWNDYEKYLRETKGWGAAAIASLDETTTDVLERLSDPTRKTARKTKGLVVGYVQSGKTANFTGVAAKAIDAGYRLIIVLTGTIEILRAQTQRRMDMELMGVENILKGQDPNDPQVRKELDYQQDSDWIANRFLRHGAALEQDLVPRIDRVTTHRSDYKRLPQGLTKLKFHKHDKSKPLNDPVNLFRSDAYVAVMKKNPAPLRQLIADLKPIQDDLAQLPVLIIDDESDQASVNTTNPAKWKSKPSGVERQRTTINKLITDLLDLCPRAQYVGYTATPFANVFIDPDDETDLFPSDFVLSLDAPPGYMGVQHFHDVGKRYDDEAKTIANSNELAFVRSLIGDRDDGTNRREQEIQEALDAWVLSGAVKKYRESVSGKKFRHHTMLVHESVKQAEHLETANDFRNLWKKSAFTSTVGLKRLRNLYDRDYFPVMEARAAGQPVPDSFDSLKPFIADAVAHMTIDGDPVLIVNADKEIQDQQKKLDFEADDVWRILVGGTQLSRGFTVEGLTVSYYRRKAGQADTLMQAGRWFGYRPGYQDLVRLYIRRDDTVDLYEAFEALLMDEEAFREELRQYEGLDDEGKPLVEPRQIPPLVSQHLPWLKPTSRSKMWNAVIASQATAGGIKDLYWLPPRGDLSNLTNLMAVGVPLLQTLASHPESLQYALSNGQTGVIEARLGLVSGNTFRDVFRRMTWSQNYLEVIRPFGTFLDSATSDGRIKDWLVVWPQPKVCRGTLTLEGVGEARVIKRSRRPRGDFVGSDRKHSEAAIQVTRGEAVGSFAGSEGRGLVLIYLSADTADDTTPLTTENVVPLLSVAVPHSATPHKRDLIQWTVRVKSQEDAPAVETGLVPSEE